MSLRWIGTMILAIVIIFALGFPLVDSADPVSQSLMKTLEAPSGEAYFGYDHLGRSMGARLAAALRLSLGIAAATLVTTAFIGVFPWRSCQLVRLLG